MNTRHDDDRSTRGRGGRAARRSLGALAVALLGVSLVLPGGSGRAAARAGYGTSAPSAPPAAAATPMPSMPGMPNMGGQPSSSPYGAPMTMTEGALQMEMLPVSGKAPKWTEISAVDHMLERAKAVTAKYRDARVAERDGYITAPALYVASQGLHYVNFGYFPSAMHRGFDLLHPPVLVYNRVNGKLALSGLMYYMPYRTTPRQLAAIFPASMASWHTHINICIAGAGEQGLLAPTAHVLPIHTATACAAAHAAFIPHIGWMVHAWIWDTTSGLFDMDR